MLALQEEYKETEVLYYLFEYCSPQTQWEQESLYEAYTYANLNNIKDKADEHDKICIALEYYQRKKKLIDTCNTYKEKDSPPVNNV